MQESEYSNEFDEDGEENLEAYEHVIKRQLDDVVFTIITCPDCGYEKPMIIPQKLKANFMVSPETYFEFGMN